MKMKLLALAVLLAVALAAPVAASAPTYQPLASRSVERGTNNG